MKHLFLFSLFLASLITQAQPISNATDSSEVLYYEPNILTTQIYKRGFYMNFEEFRRNSPSITKSFKIYRQFVKKRSGGQEFDLSIQDTTLRWKQFQETIWGFCDGKHIYINVDNFRPSHGFYKIQYAGRFTYVDSGRPSRKGNPSRFVVPILAGGLVAGVTAGAVNSVRQKYRGYLLDLKTGKSYAINEGIVTGVLSQEPDLLERFRRETRKSDVAYLYIKLYNERHLYEMK